MSLENRDQSQGGLLARWPKCTWCFRSPQKASGISVESPNNQYDTGKMRKSSLSMARDKKRRDLLSLQGQNQAKRGDPPPLSPKLDVLSFSSLSMLSMEVCKEVPPIADPIRIPHLRRTKFIKSASALQDNLNAQWHEWHEWQNAISLLCRK